MENYILRLGYDVGLTMLDILLLGLCPVFAALGTTVSASIKRVSQKVEFEEATELTDSELGKDETSLSDEEKLKLYNERRKQEHIEYEYSKNRTEAQRLAYIGFVLGLVIALYFVGSIKEDITAVARILALCVLLGYQAPLLWSLQESVIKNAAEKKVRELTGKKLKP